MPSSNANQFGSFVPITDVFDVSAIYDLDINSREFKEFLVRLRQIINAIAIALNGKDAGFYPLVEFVNGQQYFPDPTLNSHSTLTPTQRQVFRLVVNFGALPNATTKSVAHGLSPTDAWSFTRIYATATDPVGMNYIPIPYVSVAGTEGIELKVDATNVTIITQSDRTAFTTTYVVLEYLKQ